MKEDFFSSNPFYVVWDISMSVLFDIYMDHILKSYYWPMYVAGNMDDWNAEFKKLFNLSNLCKPY